MQKSPEEIAAGLSEWERGELLRTRKRVVTHCGLMRFIELGLEELSLHGYAITPFGRAVAACLERGATP